MDWNSSGGSNRSPLPGEPCYLCLSGRVPTLAKTVSGGNPEVSESGGSRCLFAHKEQKHGISEATRSEHRKPRRDLPGGRPQRRLEAELLDGGGQQAAPADQQARPWLVTRQGDTAEQALIAKACAMQV